ncbi:MAG TPA: X-Pro dipeptidyl-peptidase, partial [Gemmatimonadota bacterium]|nr:X-Pro dipeptidyl-peptidase [Gemmatimonadota bacterium]
MRLAPARSRTARPAALAALACLAAASGAAAPAGPAAAREAAAREAAPTSLEARYSKTHVMVPMRDGTRLYTIVYAPRDTTRDHPILLFRTPYSIAPYED